MILSPFLTAQLRTSKISEVNGPKHGLAACNESSMERPGLLEAQHPMPTFCNSTDTSSLTAQCLPFDQWAVGRQLGEWCFRHRDSQLRRGSFRYFRLTPGGAEAVGCHLPAARTSQKWGRAYPVQSTRALNSGISDGLFRRGHHDWPEGIFPSN